MTRLLLIRHGRTAWNAQKRLQGRTDIPLSDEGRAEVRRWRVPEEFRRFDRVCSPLGRARETARLLGGASRIEPALIEMSWGAWEGQCFAALQEQLGNDMRRNQARGLDFRPEQGESPREVQARLAPFLRGLRRSTLAVSHKGIVQAIHALATGWRMIGKPPHKLRDGAAHLFDVTDGQPVIVRLNIPLEVS
jgi:probable phosphoglycerate mutase